MRYSSIWQGRYLQRIQVCLLKTPNSDKGIKIQKTIIPVDVLANIYFKVINSKNDVLVVKWCVIKCVKGSKYQSKIEISFRNP